MKNLILILITVTCLSGCGWFDRYVVANVTGFSRTCVDGVEYHQYPSGVTVAYTPEGKVKTCK